MLAIYYGSFEDHHSLRAEEWQLISQLQEESPFGMPETRELNIRKILENCTRLMNFYLNK